MQASPLGRARYQNTGEEKYLDWCQWVVTNIEKWSGTNYYSKLDNVARGDLGMNQLLRKVHAHTFQMNALGLMRMYLATRDETYLQRVRGAWNDIASKRTYITGARSHREYYGADYELPNEDEGIETCAVMSWIQLSQALLEATGDPAYAEMIERAMWNHAFASQAWKGDGFRYGRTAGRVEAGNVLHRPELLQRKWTTHVGHSARYVLRPFERYAVRESVHSLHGAGAARSGRTGRSDSTHGLFHR